MLMSVQGTRDLGSKCAYFRKRVLGLTQADVARDLYVDRSTVSDFERGRNTSYLILDWYLGHGILLTFSLTDLGLGRTWEARTP